MFIDGAIVTEDDLVGEKDLDNHNLSETWESTDNYQHARACQNTGCDHAVTEDCEFDAEGNYVTNGGRVLGVTAKGKTLVEARANAYKATELVQFDNKYMRHDIGKAIDEA